MEERIRRRTAAHFWPDDGVSDPLTNDATFDGTATPGTPDVFLEVPIPESCVFLMSVQACSSELIPGGTVGAVGGTVLVRREGAAAATIAATALVSSVYAYAAAIVAGGPTGSKLQLTVDPTTATPGSPYRTRVRVVVVPCPSV